MAIEKNSIITAADINSYNATKELVYSGRPSKTIGSDDEDWYFNNVWFRNNDEYNIIIDMDDNDQYKIRFYTDVSQATKIFEWVGDEETPNTNTPGWITHMVYNWPERKYMPAIDIPANTEVFMRIMYEDKAFQSRPDSWVLSLTRGQTDNAVGDNIRVWESDFSALLAEQATNIDVALANTGVLGHE